MKRVGLVTVLALGLAVPGAADVTVKMTTGGTAAGSASKTPGTLYIKGNKMRSDIVMGGRVQTTIFDVDAQRMYSFDSAKNEADLWDMQALSAELSKGFDPSDVKASITPNGRTKPLMASTATGYDLEIVVTANVAGNDAMRMTATLAGPVWLAKDAPGAADYTRFYRAAAEKGFIFSDPRAAKMQPGPAKAMAEMYRQLAAAGGILLESAFQIKMTGTGPMAALLAKLGDVSITTLVESVSTAPLADALFAPSASYTVTPRK